MWKVRLAVFLALTGGPAPALAASIGYNINCYLTTDGCTAGANYGTITFSQIENYAGTPYDAVQVYVDLWGDGVHKVQEIALNYTGIVPGLTSLPTDFQYSLDGIKPDGYGGAFDIQLPDSGNLGTEPFNGVFYSASNDVLLSSFAGLSNAPSGVTALPFAIHVGNTNCSNSATAGCVPGSGGTGSLWLSGSTSVTPPDPPPPPTVPEPGTLMMMGSGFVLVAMAVRRRSRR